MPRESTAELWIEARKRALARAFELTKRKYRARDLVDQAVEEALDPERRPWDPERHPDLATYLCSLVWSIHGTELASYRVTHASERLDLAPDRAAPSSGNPERLLAAARTEKEAAAFEEGVVRRSKGDRLVTILLEEQNAADPEPAAPGRSREPASTARALALGFSLAEVANARKRLKRYALSVVRELWGERGEAGDKGDKGDEGDKGDKEEEEATG